MIRLEGSIALGLDEFMLRLGHLKVLLPVLARSSGNRARVARELGDILTRPVTVPTSAYADVGKYLVRKRLARIVEPDGTVTGAHSKARYGDLEVVEDSSGLLELRGARSVPEIWYQDLAISAVETRSKVGAVTVERRQVANKSGVSHLVDWAVIVGLANRRLGLTAIGRAIGAVASVDTTKPPLLRDNPYVIGAESVAFGWLLFKADGDVLTRLIRKVTGLAEFGKSDAVELLVEVIQDMRTEVARETTLKASIARSIREFEADCGLGKSRRRGRDKLPSTVWHRMSSRLESLVDIGLLEKHAPAGESRQFEYYYRPTEALGELANSIERAPTLADWMESRLVFGVVRGRNMERGDRGQMEFLLKRALKIALGPTGVHIDSFLVIAVTLAAEVGLRLSFNVARDILLEAAMRHPEQLRLSRGYSGSRAEFVSIVSPKTLDEVPLFL